MEMFKYYDETSDTEMTMVKATKQQAEKGNTHIVVSLTTHTNTHTSKCNEWMSEWEKDENETQRNETTLLCENDTKLVKFAFYA